jgi:sodium/hydrogen antiporter
MEYFVVLAVLGAAVLATAVLPGPLRRLPLSMPIIAVAVGAVLFSLPLGLDGPRPGADDDIAERLTELVVIVSLTGAGLKLQRSVGWRSWMTTWRLLGITMPLTVAAIAVMGSVGLGLPLAAAVLLGAVLAPTDPVLASEVQLPGPGEGEDGEENSIRFALTSEAGLNDGLAFPFTNLAIAIAVGGNWFLGWFLDDVVLKLSIGLVSGLVLGRLIGWLTFGRRSRYAFARSGEGLVAFGITLTVYGVTEMLHGYGFLAVFVAAVTLRQREKSHEFCGVMHDFADTLERIASRHGRLRCASPCAQCGLSSGTRHCGHTNAGSVESSGTDECTGAERLLNSCSRPSAGCIASSRLLRDGSITQRSISGWQLRQENAVRPHGQSRASVTSEPHTRHGVPARP